MSRVQRLANVAALALGVALIAEAVFSGRPAMTAPPAIVALACMLALLAAREGAGFAVRGGAIATNLLCTLGLAALLVVAGIGLARGLVETRGMLVASIAVPLLLLAIANVRASVGPRPWDDAPHS